MWPRAARFCAGIDQFGRCYRLGRAEAMAGLSGLRVVQLARCTWRCWAIPAGMDGARERGARERAARSAAALSQMYRLAGPTRGWLVVCAQG